MEFFSSAINTLQIVVGGIGAGVGILGIINYLDAYSNDNASGKSSGFKQLVAGGGIVLVATTLIPLLNSVLG